MSEQITLEVETIPVDLSTDILDLSEEQLAMVGGGQGMTVL